MSQSRYDASGGTKQSLTSLQADVGQLRIKSKNNLQVTFFSGNIRFFDGSSATIPEQTITLFDNSTNEIMLDLFSLTYHVFTRALHAGAIHICTLTTISGQITNAKNYTFTQIPLDKIGKFKQKLLRTNEPVKIAIIGDSLAEPVHDNIKWTDLLFNSGLSSYGFNLPNLSTILVDNYASGGMTAHYSSALMGSAVSCVNSKYNFTQITHDAYYEARYNSGNILSKSPLLSKTYDLAIICWGQNGGTDSYMHLEHIVRELRLKGTEVIILTENSRPGNDMSMWYEGLTYQKIANVYGCALVDTWAYVLEKNKRGTNTFLDTVHQNDEGHKCYAMALRSVINDRQQEVFNANVKSISKFALSPSNANESKKAFNATEVQFIPFDTNGTVISGGATNALTNIGILYGGKSASNYITSLTVGQYAWFGHASSIAVDFLVDQTTAFTADVYTQNGVTKIGSITGSAIANKAGLIEGVGYDVFTDIDTTFGFMNIPIQVVVTSGTMRVIGAVFYTLKNTNIKFEEITWLGTWADEAYSFGHNQSHYTDTIGDSLVYEFRGSGINILVGNRTTSGVIDAYLDGVKIISGLDLYNSGSYVYKLNMLPDITNGYINDFDKHIVVVKLTGVGVTASGNATSTKARRLSILDVRVIDGR